LDLRYTINKSTIETDHLGVSELLAFYKYAKQYYRRKINLDLTKTSNVDANLSAVLLALCEKLKRENQLYIYVETASHQNVFFRNGLISHLMGNGNTNKYPDNRESTIPLKTFTQDKDEDYCSYIKREFFGHRGLMYVQSRTKEQLRTHYEEVFINVGLHAETNLPVYTCGQYYPEKQNLKFTLVDLGAGFLKKIKEKTNGKVADDKSAIIWSTEGYNSTKDINSFGPGGTGLKELKKYCNENNGSLHICSGSGYVNMLSGKTIEYNLATPFPGSIINIIMRKI